MLTMKNYTNTITGLLMACLVLQLFLPIFAEDYILAPGDTLEIKVVSKPELNTKQTIAPDGSISIPQVGRITVNTQTLPQLDAILKKELSKYITRPQFSVFLTPRPIYVVQNDVGTLTSEVKEAKNIAEANAYMGVASSTMNYGDVVTVNIGIERDFWADNWIKVMSAIGVIIIGLLNVGK
jgi:hypothetical protein